MNTVLEPAAITATATVTVSTDTLVAQVADRTTDVAGAVRTFIEIAETGQLIRLISAADALRSELCILIGALGPAARAGRTVDPAAVAAALHARHCTGWATNLGKMY
ncbi:hypothetical protein ACWIGW_44210 [Nocardia brasiliensis]